MQTETTDIFYTGESCSLEDTRKLAGRLAAKLRPGDVVAFYGNLGSGKTAFIKELCRAWNCRQEATSPTFTIINEYQTAGGQLVYHFDFYRLKSEAELSNLGLDEFFYNDFICLIEWADKIEAFLPSVRWEVRLNFSPRQTDCREVTILKREESHADAQ